MADGQAHDDSPTRVVELVVNLDDVTGEQVGAVIDRLLAAGALDAWSTPITMKKGRPAVMLSVLAREQDQIKLTEQLLADTGSFGVRYRTWDRMVLGRTFYERDTRLGRLKIKAGSLGEHGLAVKPEFDAVLALARSANVPLSEAQSVARSAADALRAELEEADHA